MKTNKGNLFAVQVARARRQVERDLLGGFMEQAKAFLDISNARNEMLANKEELQRLESELLDAWKELSVKQISQRQANI